MIWIIGFVAVVTAAFVALILHRREKATRPPHAYERGFWCGT